MQRSVPEWMDGLGVSRKAGRIRDRRGVRACDCEEGGRESVKVKSGKGRDGAERRIKSRWILTSSLCFPTKKHL